MKGVGGWKNKNDSRTKKVKGCKSNKRERRAEDEMRNNTRKNDLGERAEGEVVGGIKMERNNDVTEKIEGMQSNTEKMKGED